ncbi:GNAT family N-acetyltransferase [Arthrobacter sp. NPDC057259]|uniref:GNAT family N-acetyltransferase n=1 Tax=Arthrobacter sp. NPDC057259 TaxID=3346073 RepID=UPI00362962FD
MKPLIRPALEADFEAIERIENSADHLLTDWLKVGPWDPAPIGAERAAEPGFLLIAESPEGGASGFVHVIERDGAAHLEQVSVLPEHGRRGVGTALVLAAKNEAAARGYLELTLRTFVDVPWNAPFYARLGFVPSVPTTSLQRLLLETEGRLGLEGYEARQQMTASLEAHRP